MHCLLECSYMIKGILALVIFLDQLCKVEGLTFLPSFVDLLGGLLASNSILGMEMALEP